MSKEHTGRKLALGTVVAGAVGYVTGILTAPKSGKATRQELAGTAEDVKKNAEQQLQDLNKDLNGLINETKKKTVALGAQARKEFDETVVKAKDAQNKASSVLKAVKAGEAEDPQLNRAIKQAKLAKKSLGKYLKK
ncbi:MAG: YtxH domain-containing protein [Candidatus Saccharimonadales bacterium]|jgi:gas vesicle protein